MRFKYSKFPALPCDAFPNLKHVWRPAIPIKIIYKKNSYSYLALVDSGADSCIFHGRIGDLLKLPVKNGKVSPLYGITEGRGIVYYYNVILEIGGWQFKSYVGFSYDLKHPLGILGQTGFFEFFRVTFDFKKKVIDVYPKYIK